MWNAGTFSESVLGTRGRLAGRFINGGGLVGLSALFHRSCV